MRILIPLITVFFCASLNAQDLNLLEKTNDEVPGVYQGAFDFGDYDGDGDSDLFLTGDTQSLIGQGKIAQMYQNDGSGNFTFIDVGDFEGVDKGVVQFVDIDGDCDLDLFVNGSNNSHIYRSTFYRNNGDDGFELIENSVYVCRFAQVIFEDFDGDGDNDFVISGDQNPGSYTKLYLNDGTGIFTLPPNNYYLSVICEGTLDAGDVDGDSDLDILVSGTITGGTKASALYLNDGAGNFSSSPFLPFYDYQSQGGFADVDSDGDLDIVFGSMVSSSLNDSRIYKNDGLGNYTLAAEVPFDDLRNSYIDLGDIDADGDIDVLIQGYDSQIADRSTRVYLNDGSGVYTADPDTSLAAGSFMYQRMANVNANPNLEVFITGWLSSGFVSQLYVHEGAEDALPTIPLSEITVYPNPVYNELFIQYEGTEDIDELYLTSMNGSISFLDVYEYHHSCLKSIVPDDAQGVYFLSIHTTNGAIYHKRVVLL